MTSNRPYFDWQSPADFLAIVKQHGDELGESWKNRIGREFREAHIAGRFAHFRSASSVKLLEPGTDRPTPDFAIKFQIDERRFGSDERWYETTEIDRPARRRGAEQVLTSPSLVGNDEWVSADQYHEILRDRSSAKARKPYAKCDGLIIYDNAWPITDPETINNEWWRSGTTLARSTFAEVWIFDEKSFQLIE